VNRVICFLNLKYKYKKRYKLVSVKPRGIEIDSIAVGLYTSNDGATVIQLWNVFLREQKSKKVVFDDKPGQSD
jgi:hypothetical protein